MIDWAARASAQLAQPRGGGTAKTDEIRISSVSSVLPAANAEISAGVSSVSSAPAGHVPAAQRDSGNPYLTPEQGDDCHDGGWSDAEIATFTARATRFAKVRRADAEHLAERLTLRDRQADDRKMCVECRELEPAGRCGAARRGAIPGADLRLEPVPDVLMRCEGLRWTVGACRDEEAGDDDDDQPY